MCVCVVQSLLLQQLYSMKQQTHRWVQCFILFNRYKGLSSCCLSAIPSHCSFPLFSISHWALAFPAHCLCRRDGTIKQRKLPRGAADCRCIWFSEEPVEGNGQNRSPNPVMQVSQEQPNWDWWKEATEVAGVQLLLRDTECWIGTTVSLNLIGFPPEMFISLTALLRSSSPT